LLIGSGEFGSIRLSFFYWGHPKKRELPTLTFRNRPQVKLLKGGLKILAVGHYSQGKN